MKSPVSSIALRVLYLLVGGLPALFLSVLCLTFGQDTVWAISHTAGTEQTESVILALVFAFGVLGTVSGWLAFFAVDTSSVTGRTVHPLFISSGVGAAVLFEWQAEQKSEVETQAREARWRRVDQEITNAIAVVQKDEADLENGREPLPGERLGMVWGGTRLTQDYFDRIRALELAVQAAKERLDNAYQARDALRSRPMGSPLQTYSRKAVCAMALGGFMATASAAQWSIIDLSSIGGAYSDSKGINDHSQVVGSAYTSGNTFYHAFLFDRGTMMDLGTLGGANSVATGINNDGAVVGSSYTAHDAVEHAFVYRQPGKMTDLGTLGGKHKNSVARGVNNQGQVVGYSDTARDAGPHAFLYSHGRMRDLGTLGGTSSTARAINDGGWVAGDAHVAGDHAYHAFLYRNGTLQDLGTLGGTNSSARAINGGGWVAGDADTAGDAAHHVFLYRDGTMQDLGSLGGKNSLAYGINNRGQVVGYSDTTPITLHFKLGGGGPVREVALRRQTAGIPKNPADDTYPVHGDGPVIGHLGDLYAFDHHAFLYDGKGGMLDLSQLPEVLAAGWSSLNYAYAINDRGEIIGSGTIGDKFHAFLLSPVTALGR